MAVSFTVVPDGKSREDRPSFAELHLNVVPQYAVHWESIGTILGLEQHHINNISMSNAYNPNRVVDGCAEMLKRWLRTDSSATWGKLDDAIRPSLTGAATDDYHHVRGNSVLSSHLKTYYINSRFITEHDQWPPQQPKHYTPLVLVHQKGQPSLEETTTMASATMKGNIDQYISTTSSKITKDLREILSQLEQSSNCGQPRVILVEGSPGIGKSVLLKQIAYLWASNTLLIHSDYLFLLYLRDPAVQQINSLEHLVQHFYKQDKEVESHLLQGEGKYVTLLLDGYDELPADLRQSSFIADILQFRVLPASTIVVSSRPHASSCLHDNVICRVEILGFSEEDQTHFIQQSLEGQREEISRLNKYLTTHPTIANLCFIPFNMTTLMFIYKRRKNLPTCSTELYKLFICLTIRRHLAKLGVSLNENIRNLDSLPQPYNDIIKQLSLFAFTALNKNQLVFSLAEIKYHCPAITDHPNGFGLLQAVEYVDVDLMNKTFSYNFVHFSVQEFLAGYYVTKVPLDEECTILQKYFWSSIHYNMFYFYVTLTEGQSPPFKEFLCCGNDVITIDSQFLENKLQLLHLYRIFYEADDSQMCQVIEETFTVNAISLEGTTLSPSSLEDLATVLTCSSCRNWEKLDLAKCHIQDYGLQLLHRNLHRSGITIKELWLEYNDLSSSSDTSLSDIVITCKVKVLGIYHNNTIGETEQFISNILTSPSTVMEVLYMHYNNYSTRWTTCLFSLLKKNTTLRCLGIGRTNISDNVCDVICEALTVNSTLRELYMWGNPITEQGSKLILNALKDNNTLELLLLTKYPECVTKEITLLQDSIHEMRRSRGCCVKLKIEFWSW